MAAIKVNGMIPKVAGFSDRIMRYMDDERADAVDWFYARAPGTVVAQDASL